MASRNDIQAFLSLFINKVKEVGLHVVDRGKNREAMKAMGLLPPQRTELIIKLGVENYCSGPEPDENGQGEVWKFGIRDGTSTIYIKLKLADQPKCISFHYADNPMDFPFAK